jgi:hypothetical protein
LNLIVRSCGIDTLSQLPRRDRGHCGDPSWLEKWRSRAGVAVTTSDVRNGRLAKTMLSVDSVVYQARYVVRLGWRSIEARATMLVMRTRVLRRRRMARRSRRGVGMNATGRIMMRSMSGMSKDRAMAVCLWYEVHCAVRVS